MRYLLCLILLLGAVSAAPAFNGHKISQGALTVEIGAIQEPAVSGKPVEVAVKLSNAGGAPLKAEVELCGVIDEWRIQGPAKKTAEVPARGSAEVKFSIVAGPGVCAALYPVRARVRCGGETIEAIQVFAAEPGKGDSGGPLSAKAANTAITVPERGGVLLERQAGYRVGWAYGEGEPKWLPAGWTGQEPQSKANFSRTETTRGTERRALGMHPPYGGGKGSVFVEYRLKLPETKPLALEFGNAIRDNAPREPKSDGVTFRVWADDGSGCKKIFERHTDSKVWVDGTADLAPYAGKEVRVTLECHPGPKMDTTCDSAFWGEPAVVAGERPAASGIDAAVREALAALAAHANGEKAFYFDLGEGCSAALALGNQGVADGALAFAADGKTVVYRGMRIEMMGQQVGKWPGAVVTGCKVERETGTGAPLIQTPADPKSIVDFGLRNADSNPVNPQSTIRNPNRPRLPYDPKYDVTLTLRHSVVLNGKETALRVVVWSEKGCLRVRVDGPERLTALAPGPETDLSVRRVFFGHGYCVDHPEAFKVRGGGHSLATSHVGFEFENGPALLVACDNPPDFLEVNPEQKICTLQTHMNANFTFVPGSHGALDCAVRYRPFFDKPAAPGVARKAGRFVFDIWGGKYAEIAEMMRRSFDYGLTDSMLLIHNWQRWGYDYRLPDIYPPNPAYGTLEELKQVGAVCRAKDVPWGLHDNYIDFYPDAEGYSYDHIVFSEGGQPVKAWINNGRDAQSYLWRSDRFQPFLKRNLEVMRDGLAPTASFVDVFTSKGCIDYLDRQGNFHSFLDTRKEWGEAFATIRDTLGGAPTVSEAGDDQLIGWIDGADCQFIELSPVPAMHTIGLRARDWERTPWADAVYHTKFSLHGAGYSTRYQNARSRREHGIESDDYMASELLTGHALMTDINAGVRGAVRKYWLAQDFVRAVANDEITRVEYDGGDIHRLTVHWSSGAFARINRSKMTWSADGRVLPQYGFLARSAQVDASIELNPDKIIVERAEGPDGFYFNARGNEPDPPVPLRPKAGAFTDLGGGKFTLALNWEAAGPVGRDLRIFVHVRKPVVSRLVRYEMAGGHRTATPTSQWRGTVTTGENDPMTIPADFPAGEYEVLAGMYDPKAGNRGRAWLMGDERDDRRYLVAKLTIAKQGSAITSLKMEPNAAEETKPRLNLAKRPVDFLHLITTGGFRYQERGEGAGREVILTPLPEEPACRVGVPLERAGLSEKAKVTAVDAKGNAVRDVEGRIENGAIWFETKEGEFGYRIK